MIGVSKPQAKTVINMKAKLEVTIIETEVLSALKYITTIQ